MKLLSFVVLCALAAGACSKEDGNSLPTNPTTTGNVAFSTVDLRSGTGAEATVGRSATVNYTLWLYSTTGVDNKGSLIESSLAAGGRPYTFTVGTGVIPGFSQGVTGMRVGGLRRVVIPPNLAYGSQGTSGIPPNSTLIFEIELLSVQ